MLITKRIGKLTLIANSFIAQSKLNYNFSNLKGKYAGLRAVNYATINQFYAELRKIESNLPYTDWVKFKKLILSKQENAKVWQTSHVK